MALANELLQKFHRDWHFAYKTILWKRLFRWLSHPGVCAAYQLQVHKYTDGSIQDDEKTVEKVLWFPHQPKRSQSKAPSFVHILPDDCEFAIVLMHIKLVMDIFTL